MDKQGGGDWYTTGALITGIIVFLVVWIYAISEWGFLVGVALGWLPAAIVGSIAGLLWPVVALIIAYLFLQS